MGMGPSARSRTQRLEIVDQIAAQIRAHYGEQLIGLGLYGSLARGTDGPCSDIEMFCILAGTGVDTVIEWTTGPWKAEVDVYTTDSLFAWAKTVEGDWPLTHSAFLDAQPIYDPHGIFPQLKQIVENTPQERLLGAMHELVVGDIYELVGKLRNNQARGEHASTAVFCVELGLRAAYLAGLGNRHFFHSASTMLDDSLGITDLPDGHVDLCQLIVSGSMADPARCYATCERYWNGVQTWISARGIFLINQLEMLLQVNPIKFSEKKSSGLDLL